MTIKYHEDLIQGSDDWLAARCGLLTASEMKHIITPSTLAPSDNARRARHLHDLMAQRLTNYVDPQYVSDDMLRGMTDEVEAKILYAKHYAAVDETGFITNDKWGFKLGFSPDGLVGDDGLIECKSRLQGLQLEVILDGALPLEFLIQVQTGMLVSERAWCDFISYSAGLPMMTLRVPADPKAHKAIIAAAAIFEADLAEKMTSYKARLKDKKIKFIPTERKPPEGEITVTATGDE